MTNNERKTVARRLLKDVALFSGLDESDLGAILDISQFRHMRAGEALFEAGESCSAVYILESGLMKLFVRGPKSQQKVIEFVEPGDSFAEAALFSGEGYPADEFCQVLDGSVTLTPADGAAQTFAAGDSYVVNKGWCGEFRVNEQFRKYYVMAS